MTSDNSLAEARSRAVMGMPHHRWMVIQDLTAPFPLIMFDKTIPQQTLQTLRNGGMLSDSVIMRILTAENLAGDWYIADPTEVQWVEALHQ